MTEPRRLWNISEHTSVLRSKAESSGLPIIDLGQGGPVAATPHVIADSLAAAGDWPSYPTTQGTPQLRKAFCAWATRRLGARVTVDSVIPTIGSKELIAGLPGLLGLSHSSLVVIPELAYPTYAVGARQVGAGVLAADSLLAIGPQRPGLIWVNTPSNPTGQVLPAEHLHKIVTWARQRGCVVASDECYLELAGAGQPTASVLSPDVNEGSLDNILAVHSLSKRSTMAGYRVGFVSGDPAIIADLLRQRRDLGLIVPGPMQAAAVAALDDDEHVRAARHAYSARRLILESALLEAGFSSELPQAGLFCWATRGQPDHETEAALAAIGILSAPGSFYGARGSQHVRLALTVSDAELEEAALRISRMG
jgi:succinyldiaminopimelate transaminase